LGGAGIIALGMALSMFGGNAKWVDKVTKSVFGMACPAAIGIPVAAYLLRTTLGSKYNPNADPEEERIARGRERAMSPQEYARLAPKPGPQLPPMP